LKIAKVGNFGPGRSSEDCINKQKRVGREDANFSEYTLGFSTLSGWVPPDQITQHSDF